MQKNLVMQCGPGLAPIGSAEPRPTNNASALEKPVSGSVQFKTRVLRFMDRSASYVLGVATGLFAEAKCLYTTFAVGSIKTDYNINPNIADVNPLGVILGLVFWIFTIVGAVNAAMGIYGFIMAKKEGETQEANSSLNKAVAGIVAAALPTVLKMIGLLN